MFWFFSFGICPIHCTETFVHIIFVMRANCNIAYSQAVTHPSANATQCCLTSVIFFYIYLLIIVVKQHLMAAYIFVASHSQQQICQTIVVNYPGSFTKICLSDLMFIIWFQTMRETSYHHPDTTTSCIPRRSPIQVLTRLNVA